MADAESIDTAGIIFSAKDVEATMWLQGKSAEEIDLFLDAMLEARLIRLKGILAEITYEEESKEKE